MSEPLRQGQAIEPRHFGPFDAEAVGAYAAASGDDNPLHVDPAIAAKAGLARPPIHGMLIMGHLQTYLSAWRPESKVGKLSAKFIKPVLVDEGFSVSGKVVKLASDEPAVIRLTVKSDADALVCLAEAFVEP